MTELSLKDKLTELTSIVKVLEKKPELNASIDVVVSFDGKVHSRIFETEDGLDFEVFNG